MPSLPWIKIDVNLIKALLRPVDKDEAIAVMVMMLDQSNGTVKPLNYYAKQFGKTRKWVEKRLRVATEGQGSSKGGAGKGQLKYNNYNILDIESSKGGAGKGQGSSKQGACTIKKDIDRDKEKPLCLPDWIDEELWAGFMEIRKKLKAPNTELAITRLISSLTKLKRSGHDPNEVIGQSIENGWKGFFPVKRNSKNKRNATDKATQGVLDWLTEKGDKHERVCAANGNALPCIPGGRDKGTD